VSKDEKAGGSSSGRYATGTMPAAAVSDKGPGHIVEDKKKPDRLAKNDKFTKRGLLIKSIVFIALIGLIIAVVLLLLFKNNKLPPFLHTAVKRAEVENRLQFIKLPVFVTTLDVDGNYYSYVKVEAELEVTDNASASAVNSAIPPIMDVFQTYLHAMTPVDLRSPQGLYRLRAAVLSRINDVIAPAAVRNVLFVEMILQ
jgi:flagellar basal body-associated protein FliL